TNRTRRSCHETLPGDGAGVDLPPPCGGSITCAGGLEQRFPGDLPLPAPRPRFGLRPHCRLLPAAVLPANSMHDPVRATLLLGPRDLLPAEDLLRAGYHLPAQLLLRAGDELPV